MEHNGNVVWVRQFYPLKHTPVDSRTGKLVVAAPEPPQLLALGERRQRACIKRANQVSFEKTEHNRQYVGYDTSIR